MKRIFFILILLSIFLVGCTGDNKTSDKEKIKVGVAILPLKDFVEKIGGENVEVSIAIPKGSSPANYEPTPMEIKNIVESKLYFSIGVPTEKGNILPKLEDEELNIIYLDKLVDDKFPVRMFDKEQEHKDEGHSHTGRDPHIWVSPIRAVYMVEIIRDELIKLDNDNKDLYEKNAQELISNINSEDEKLKKTFKGKGVAFIVFHPSLGYFADDYGLQMISIEQGGKKISANHLKNVIDLGREKNISTVLYQEEFYNQSAKQIAKELGGNARGYTVLWEDYVKGLEEIRTLLESDK